MPWLKGVSTKGCPMTPVEAGSTLLCRDAQRLAPPGCSSPGPAVRRWRRRCWRCRCLPGWPGRIRPPGGLCPPAPVTADLCWWCYPAGTAHVRPDQCQVEFLGSWPGCRSTHRLPQILWGANAPATSLYSILNPSWEHRRLPVPAGTAAAGAFLSQNAFTAPDRRSRQSQHQIHASLPPRRSLSQRLSNRAASIIVPGGVWLFRVQI